MEMIERFILKDLIAWKSSSYRKPLILRGVRQCGKTWILQEFGRQYFENTAYFNFERQNRLGEVFSGELDPKRILLELGVLAHQKIEPGRTLVIFDEIQACPRALTSLKYFCEEAPEFHIAAAGSLLGIALAASDGFPVGKVNFLELTPCSFAEYLQTADSSLFEYTNSLVSPEPIPGIFEERLTRYLNEYLTIGGMPAVLESYLANHDLPQAENIQEDILKTYELDFSKHAPVRDIPKLFLLWKSIPQQLARENARFIYGEVKSGARAKDLEDALCWLESASLIHRITRIEKPEIPLSAYEDRKSFKLYLADVGLLRKLAEIPAASILVNPDIFREYRGRLAENFVLQQMVAMQLSPIHYWTSGNLAEVDFVIQDATEILPVEVKSGLNVKAKSLKSYREKYHPGQALRFSMQNLKRDDGLLNIPLYLIHRFHDFLHSETRNSKAGEE